MSAPTPRPAPRHGVAHATAVLVLGLIVAASVEPLRPIAREVQRETAPERAAVRELTATLAKAVRSLCGSPTVKPVAFAAARTFGPLHSDEIEHGTPSTAREGPVGPALLRTELLDLPPPARG